MKLPSETPIVDMAYEGVALVAMVQKLLNKERTDVETLVTPPQE